jgi:tRNA threonylcarbamoyl adenosine modification protein YeaZ
MANLLALDTSGLDQALVLLADGRTMASTSWRRMAGEPPIIERVRKALLQAGQDARDLSAIVAGRGPGSFTGLRVGLAAGTGLAFSLGADLYLVNSLEILAARGAGSSGSIRDAGRSEVYVWRTGSEPARLSLEELEDWLGADDRLVVEPAGALQRWLPGRAALEVSMEKRRSAEEALAQCALEAVVRRRPVRYHEVEPLYAQPAAAEEREVNRK